MRPIVLTLVMRLLNFPGPRARNRRSPAVPQLTGGKKMDRVIDSPSERLSQKAFRNSTVVVAATFTADPILGPLRFWLYEVIGFIGRIELASPGQVIQMLLNKNGAFATVQEGFKVILLR